MSAPHRCTRTYFGALDKAGQTSVAEQLASRAERRAGTRYVS
ncbi:hypothetical protein [Streptomyces sp. NBC_00989]|nr:hypothetical protein OG714_45020 [Streptomyces sp. NBC_00989]